MAREEKSKRRKSLDDPADVISDLPRNVIDSIVECLPLRDAARLSVLSRKWRDIWISMPYLTFNAYFFASVLQEKIHVTHEFSGIVSKILFHHKGPILKFSLYVPRLGLRPDVVQWISFLSTSGVKEFNLENQYKMPLQLSSDLFSFVGLEKLKLHFCVFSPLPNLTCFKRLVSLVLYNVKFREGTFEDLINRCPLLEELTLVKCLGIEHVNVNAPDLKHLIVDGTFRSICVKIAGNLVTVGIVLDKLTKICHKTSLRDLIESLAKSNKLEKLCLGGHFCKVLFNDCSIATMFDKLRCLELQSICLDNLDLFSSAVHAVEKCPSLQYLVISVNTSSNLDIQVLDYNPDITLHHLRHARVGICRASSTELKLIEFLLACSPVLEVLSLSFLKHIKGSSQSRMSNQLIRFRRASPKVEVICPDPIISIESSDSGSNSDSSSGSSGSSDASSTSDSDSSESSDSDYIVL